MEEQTFMDYYFSLGFDEDSLLFTHYICNPDRSDKNEIIEITDLHTDNFFILSCNDKPEIGCSSESGRPVDNTKFIETRPVTDKEKHLYLEAMHLYDNAEYEADQDELDIIANHILQLNKEKAKPNEIVKRLKQIKFNY